ncbi:predicted protein [Nematostella vectensis]|uniref:Transmembrane protein 53 n=1 Tax=Nematostella vectensis TaxID=45351 RepID=A7SHF2_NEMVE|nr:predicted protein [Nematostella vectensis]|eukprot:XP_001628968.1 predicted protein [Nematostella vectensis]
MNHDTPVVIILGWNSSKDNHLRKYSELFEKRHFSTVRVTANPFNTFFRSGSKVKFISHYILKTLSEYNLTEKPVFLYSFSNGGCAMYFHIMEALTKSDSEFFNTINIRGSIFDSCPINPNIESVKLVQSSVTDNVKNPIAKAAIWYSLGIFTPLVVYLNPTVKKFMSELEQAPLHSPQLVLYSKSDRLAPYKDIDKYVLVRRALGVSVTAKCWEKSGHVNHMREHPEEYIKYLNEFLDHCLR